VSSERSNTKSVRTLFRKVSATKRAGRLAALFVLVAVAATLTVSSALSAGASRGEQAGPAPSGDSRSSAFPGAGGPALKSSPSGATAQDDVSGPNLTTDKSSYAPGETITFRGTNWSPGETVTILLQGGGEGSPVEIQATADDSGTFTVTGRMPAGEESAAAKSRSSSAAQGQAEGAVAAAAANAGEHYTATATGGASGATAQVQINKDEPGGPDGDENDPDLPAFMAGKVNKADYLRRRAEHVNKLRGIHPGKPVDPGARGRAIREMNRQEGRPDDSTSTIDPVKTDAADGMSASAQSVESISSSSPLWKAIGPAPLPNGQTFQTNNVAVSGRTVTIALHPTDPNIAYVGAAQGGVYRTTDGGATWTAIFDNAQTLAIGSIAIAPSQPSTIYVGTGEGTMSCDTFAGVGLYRIDNADGPNPVMTGPLNRDANGNDVLTGWATGKVLVHPTNPDIVFISTTTGYAGLNCYPVGDTTSTAVKPRGLFRSTNATQANPTFTKLTIAGVQNGGNRSIRDLEFEPGNPNVLLATVYGGGSTGADAGVYRTTNALDASPSFTRTLAVGDTSTLFRTELALTRIGNQTTVFAATSEANGTLKRSTDGGVTWSGVLGSTGFCGGQCTYDLAIAVDPYTANTVYLGGAGNGSGAAAILTKVTNALGTPTFTKAQTGLHADTHAIEIDRNNTNVVWTGNDGGIFKSANAASSWTSLNTTGYSATQFMSIALHPTDANFTLGGTQDNGTECQGPCGSYTGNTWNQADYGDGGFALIDQSATGLTNVNMYHTYWNGRSQLIGYAYVTNAANAKFTSEPISNNWSFIGTGGSASCTNGGGYACTEYVEFYMPLALGPGTPNPVYSGTDRLHRAASPGSTNATVSQTFATTISAIAVSRQNDGVRLVGLSNGQVWRTMNGSTTLTNVSGTLPTGASYYISRAAIDPNNQNTAYVTYSTYFGNPTSHIYKTTNLNAATPTWTGVDGGQIPDIPINAFAVDPADSNMLYAGTDIGVYRSTNAGTTWAPFSNGLPRVAVFDMAIQNQHRILRIATHGRGMWEVSLNAPVNPGTLQGTVTDSATNGPVSGATVTAGSNTTTTNASGYYVFGEIEPGTYSVTASAPGYKAAPSASVTVTSDNTTTRDFSLTPAPASGCLTDTSQADFDAGVKTSVDTSFSPGNVILASGAEALDQQQTNTGNTQGLSVSATVWTGNTFTPATSGKLTKIDASFFNLANLSGGNVVVEIRTVSGTLPTSTVLATGTFAITGTASGFYTATFSNPPTLTAGTRYAYVARTTSGSTAMHRRANGAADYVNGNAVQSTNSGSSWALNDPDVAFRTYMSAGYTASGDLTSSTKDSNPASGVSPNWTTLSWTAGTPSGTTVRFQAAASNSASGPFSFVGPDGTASTYFTTSGASLSQFNGKRYLKYKAYLSTTSSGATPTLGDVTACFQNGALPATTTTVGSASGTYGGTTPLTATLTSGGSPLAGKLITFTLNGTGVGSAMTNASGVATLTNASLSGINAGSYPGGVGASFASDGNHAGSFGSNGLTVGKATPAVNWSNPEGITYGAALGASQLNATASVPGAFAYTPAAGVVPGAGDNQTLRVDFTPTDSTNYGAASKEVSINVAKAGLTVTAEDKSRAYSAANPAFTYTLTGFVGGDTQAGATTGEPSLSTTAGPDSPVGTYPIAAAAGTLGSANYSFSFADGTLTITQADQTITFGALGARTFGDADFTVSASASSGLPVSFDATGDCTLSGATVRINAAGSCTVTASQAGNSNYTAATSVPQSFQINKAGTTTTVTAADATYDGQPHGGSAAVSGAGGLSQSLPVTYAGRNGTAYGPSTTAPTDAGDYTASATYGGGDDHEGSSDSKEFTIAKAAAAISLDGLSRTYTGSPLAATAATNPAGLPGLTVTYDGSTDAPTNAGTYAVVASLSNGNYSAPSATGMLVIGKATPAVNVAGGTYTYDGDAHPATGSVTGVGGADLGAPSFTYNGGAGAPVNAGTYLVVASFGGDTNYEPASNTATVTIGKATATITLGGLYHLFDGAAKSGTAATSPAGLPGLTVTYDGSATAPAAAGNYAVVASLTNDNYAAPEANGTMVINRPPVARVRNVTVNSDSDCSATGAATSVNDGSSDPDGNAITVTQSPAGPYPLGTTNVTLTVKDSFGETSTLAATVTVVNPNPAATITGPTGATVYAKGTTVNFAGAYTDNPGSAYTATWTIQSGTQTVNIPGTINTATGAVTATHTFNTTGVYLVKLTVTDGCGGTGGASQTGGADMLVAIFDRAGGTVATTAKSPTINSPAGAFAANPALTGFATTGFNAAYSTTGSVPTGQAVFNFAAANLNFASTGFQWMAVTRPHVWLRGAGTVNNQSGYEFLIAAVDGQLTGGGGADKFRIRIWRKADGAVVYDNLMGGALNAPAATNTTNGDIAIK